eukprot:COSAG02_NODE_5584_length_4212_cov_4.368344_1_plen_88_part_00
MAEDDVETELLGVLLYAKCHTTYAPQGSTGTLLELVEGDIVAVVQEKAETGWCVSRFKLSSRIPGTDDCHATETARHCEPAGIPDSC